MDEQQILGLSLQEAWTLYKIKKRDMIEEEITNETEYKTARFGKNIMFEIDEYLMDSPVFRKRPKAKCINIYGQEYTLEDFRTELETREEIIRGALIDYYAQINDSVM